ncbi:hypothetical protein QTP88_002331 [Uroleucon formosanum]
MCNPEFKNNPNKCVQQPVKIWHTIYDEHGRRTLCTRDDRTRRTETPPLTPSPRARQPSPLMLPPPPPPPKENLIAPRAGCPVHRLWRRRWQANNAVFPTAPAPSLILCHHAADRVLDGRGSSSPTQLLSDRESTRKIPEHRSSPSYLKLGVCLCTGTELLRAGQRRNSGGKKSDVFESTPSSPRGMVMGSKTISADINRFSRKSNRILDRKIPILEYNIIVVESYQLISNLRHQNSKAEEFQNFSKQLVEIRVNSEK